MNRIEHGSDKEALLDILLDLKHDLGKYLLLPVHMEISTGGNVREGVRRALFETQRNRQGTRCAREIWHCFRAELLPAIERYEKWRILVNQVARTFDWEKCIDGRRPLDEKAVLADFESVGRCIQALIEEVSRDSRTSTDFVD